MIRLSDSIGLSAFQDWDRPARDNAGPGHRLDEAAALAGDFLVGATRIHSDPEPGARGLSVAQHAAHVLSHLCRAGP